MSYINRFSFDATIAFKFLYRGVDYLNRIYDYSIDGNIVHAKIIGTNEYDTSFAINFETHKIMYYKCSCPYSENSRKCKHIAALMLYTDILLNGGNLDELLSYYVAEAIIEILRENDLLVNEEKLRGYIINRNTHSIYHKESYEMPYYDSISEKIYEKAKKILIDKQIIEINHDGLIFKSKRKILKNPYFKFFSKYSLLIKYDEDDEDYYLYGNEEKVVKKGFDVTRCSYLFSSNNDKYHFLFDIDKNNIIYPFENEDFGYSSSRNIIPIEPKSLSSNFYEFFISTIDDLKIKNELLNNFQNNKFDFDSLNNNLKQKYRILERNYYIGVGIKFFIDNNINFSIDGNNSY